MKHYVTIPRVRERLGHDHDDALVTQRLAHPLHGTITMTPWSRNALLTPSLTLPSPSQCLNVLDTPPQSARFPRATTSNGLRRCAYLPTAFTNAPAPAPAPATSPSASNTPVPRSDSLTPSPTATPFAEHTASSANRGPASEASFSRNATAFSHKSERFFDVNTLARTRGGRKRPFAPPPVAGKDEAIFHTHRFFSFHSSHVGKAALSRRPGVPG